MRYLHLADNNYVDISDKFAKVRPLFNIFSENCLRNFIPERNISFDEFMVPYFVRHGCKQYIQRKPVKSGYKLCVEATPLGYAIQIYPYAGKDANYNKELGFGALCLCH